MTMNIFALAGDNSSSLQARFESAKAEKSLEELATIERFAERVLGTSQVSINMYPWVLAGIIVKGEYKNIYEWAEEQSSLSGRSMDEILREKLGSFCDRRLAFDGSFEHGRSFRYGALNMGGVCGFGDRPFCIVLRQDFPERADAVAYLRSDSLKTYVDAAGRIDEQTLAEGLASHSSRHYLTTLKHIGQIPVTHETEWHLLVCSDKDYVEAIFTGTVTTDEFDEVRVPDAEFDKLWDITFADYGRKRPIGDAALAAHFEMILRAEQEGVICLKRV